MPLCLHRWLKRVVLLESTTTYTDFNPCQTSRFCSLYSLDELVLPPYRTQNFVHSRANLLYTISTNKIHDFIVKLELEDDSMIFILYIVAEACWEHIVPSSYFETTYVQSVEEVLLSSTKEVVDDFL